MKELIEKLKIQLGLAKTKDVALVLGGGGARGYAHIGAIEVLQEHGYNITSVAGTSMGALVGGLFCAGKLEELKDTVLSINKRQILSLMDISVGLDHIATGESLVKLLKEMTGEVKIEDLPIPFCCPASNIADGKEYVFREGSLSDAIRASISIPCFFSPIHIDEKILVDGSVHDTLPLDLVERHKHDTLVAVNASGAFSKNPGPIIKDDTKQAEKKHGTTWKWLTRRLPIFKAQFSENYLNMALRIAQMSIYNSTQQAMRITPPDFYAEVPSDRFSIMDFHRGKEIIEYGREIMEEALD